jgi:ATP-binding cassette subfamily F protein 3
MAAVTVQNVTKQFGTHMVLDGVSLDIHPGETVGLVGANGAGKTTLFRIITGEIEPDHGQVSISKGTQVGHLRQEPDVGLDRTLHDEVGSVFADLLALEHKLHAVSEQMSAHHDGPELQRLMTEYERINQRFIHEGGYTFEHRLGEILGGLGFTPADYQMKVRILSGGQKCRAALAKLLLRDPELLLLDEPTNHLDIDAVRWLERFLAGHQGGAVIISHDRYLLDRLADRIIEVERAGVRSYKGNYTTYAETKQLRILTEQRQFEKDKAFIEKEKDFINKHIAGQRTNEAKGRRTRLERRLGAGEFVTNAPTSQRTTKLSFSSHISTRSDGTTVMRCEDLSMAFDDKHLFSDLKFQLRDAERLGITGPNGVGKSTLLKIILGQLAPTTGSVEVDSKRRIGYYDQEHRDLDPNRNIVEEIRTIRREMSEESARSYLARFLFFGNDVFKPLGKLSGGEQSRVRLAKLILDAPDLLILDEPTNHLDIPSREALEEALLDYDGTVLTISHDRYFLDRIVDRLLVMRPEGWRMFGGNYSFYIDTIEQEEAQRAAAEASARTSKAKVDRAAPKPAPVAKPARSNSKYNHLSVEQLESLVIDREERLAVLNARFADPAIFRDPEALGQLKAEIDAARVELAEIDAAWHERAAD